MKRVSSHGFGLVQKWPVTHFFVSIKTEFGGAHHPMEAWWLKLHGFAAMGGLILFGSMMPVHIRNAWRQGRNRWTGSSLVVVMSVLALSGYGLYYSGSDELRSWIGNLHWVVGLMLVCCLVVHVFQRRSASGRAVVVLRADHGGQVDAVDARVSARMR